MITVYTDASLHKGKSAAVSIIYQNAQQIAILQDVRSLNKNQEAEALAVYQALMHLKAIDLLDSDEIKVYTDCINIIEQSYPRNMSKIVDNLYDMVNINNIKLEHIKAHQFEESLNKACDIISKRLLEVEG